MERMGWTWDELQAQPWDIVITLREKWRAERAAARIRKVNGRGE